MSAQYFAEYSWSPEGPKPSSVYRRIIGGDGLPEDSYVGREGHWQSDAHHTLGLWLQNRNDHDFEPITEVDAEEFVEMARVRELRRFSTSGDAPDPV